MIGKADELVTWLFNQDREKVFEIKEHRQKRSLTANAYAWTLIGKIADAMRISKDECYLLMLKRYGQSEIVSAARNFARPCMPDLMGNWHALLYIFITSIS